jgi:hypothetical protein
MTYRDDLDALAARHAALEAEVARKQRELAEVASLLAEAKRVDQAEAHFARAPVLRRRQRRHLIVGALAAVLASGGALGYAASLEPEPAVDGPCLPHSAAAARARAQQAAERADRRLAAYEALQQIGLTAKKDAVAKQRAEQAGVPFDQYLYREELASLAREHER